MDILMGTVLGWTTKSVIGPFYQKKLLSLHGALFLGLPIIRTLVIFAGAYSYILWLESDFLEYYTYRNARLGKGSRMSCVHVHVHGYGYGVRVRTGLVPPSRGYQSARAHAYMHALIVLATPLILLTSPFFYPPKADLTSLQVYSRCR